MLSVGDNILGVKVDGIIGVGSFGKAYKASLSEDDCKLCLKHVNLDILKLYEYI